MFIKKRFLQKTLTYIGIFVMLAYLVPPMGNIQTVKAVATGQLTSVSASLSSTTKGVSSNITVTFTTENDLSGSGSGDVIRVNFDMFKSGNPSLSSMKVDGTGFSGYSNVYGYYYYGGYFEVYLDENISGGSVVQMVISGMTNSELYNRELISIVTFSPDSGGTAYENCTDAGGDEQTFGDCSPFKVWLPLGTPSVSGQILGPIGTADATKGYSDTYVGMWNSSNYWDSTNTDHLGKFYFYDTPTGSHQVEASIPWGISFSYSAPAKQTISVTSGSTTNMGILRYQFPSATGVVKNESTGNPIQGAYVTYMNIPSPGQNTDENGRFYLPAMDAGTYTVSFSTSGIEGETASLVAPDPVSITVDGVSTYNMGNILFGTANKTIKGYVKYPNGAAVADAQIGCNQPMGGGEWKSASTNISGYYELLVGKGTWMCMAEHDWSQSQADFDWVNFDMPMPITFSLENPITEIKTQNYTVTLVDSTITGKVLKPNGTVFTDGGMNIDTYTQMGFGNWTSVDQSTGVFTAKVPAGTYQVMVNLWNDNWGGPTPQTVTVAANSTYNLGTLYLVPKSARISGTVTDDNGTPLDQQYVDCFVPGEWGKWASGSTDANGEFSFKAFGGATYMCNPMTSYGGWGGEAGEQYVYLGAPVTANLPNVNSIASNINFEVTRADATVNVSAVDENGSQVSLFGYAYVDQSAAGGGTDPMMMGPGFGCPLSNGACSMKVPSAMCTSTSLCNLNVSSPPGTGSEYSSAGAVAFSTTANSTTNVEVVMVPNNAVISGFIKDTDGNAITGIAAMVFADNFSNMSFSEAHVNTATGAYSLNVAPGEYHIGYWVDPTLGYMASGLTDNKVTAINDQTVTKDLTLQQIDSWITVTVKAPNGNPMPGAFVDVSTSSGLGGIGSGHGGPMMGPGMMGPGMMGQMTNSNGQATVGVPGGSGTPATYYVSASLPPEMSYINPTKQTVAILSGETQTLTMNFRESDATISGTTTIDGTATTAYISAWSETGGFTEAFSYNGAYILNVTKDDNWHVNAKSMFGQDYYKSGEQVVAVEESMETLNLELNLAAANIPEAVTASFDPSNQAIISLSDGTTINVPAGGIKSSGNNLTLTATPTIEIADTTDAKPVSYGISLEVMQDGTTIESNFTGNVTITQPYDEDLITALGLNENTDLGNSYWDDSTGTWKTAENVTVNTENNVIVTSVNHFTNFAITSAEISAPQITITTPDNGAMVSVNSVTVEGTVSDPNATVTIALDSTSIGTVAVNSSTGVFMKTVTGLSSGSNIITIDAVNGVGRASTVTRTVTYNLFEEEDLPGSATGVELSLITMPKYGAPQVRMFDNEGTVQGQFYAYDENLRGEFNVLTADITGDGNKEIITFPGEGFPSHIRVFDNDGTFIDHFFAYQEEFLGGVIVKAADIDGDGAADLVVQPDKGGGPNIRVFTYNDATEGLELLSWEIVYQDTFRGEIGMTVSDVDGDGKAEIVTSPLTQGGANVRMYTYNTTTQSLELVDWFIAFHELFRGGADVAVGNVTGDSTKEIVVTPASDAGPHVRVYEYRSDTGTFNLLTQFWAYAETYRGGVKVKIADVNNDGVSEIITTPTKGGPHVRVFSHNSSTGIFDLLDDMMVYPDNFRGGVNLAISDIDGDGLIEIVTSPKQDGGPHVRVYEYVADSSSIELMTDIMAYDEAFRGMIDLKVFDMEGDGTSEIITSPLTRGGPNVRVHGYRDDSLVAEVGFWAYAETFSGGVKVTTAN